MIENSVTISAGGESVTFTESDLRQIPAHETPQALYDSIVSLRKQRSFLRRDRTERLNKESRYVRLKSELSTVGKEKKQIEIDFDKEQPDFKNAIEHASDNLFKKETQLAAMALAAYKSGSPLELIRKTRKGKVKKIQITYKIQYKQLSLF